MALGGLWNEASGCHYKKFLSPYQYKSELDIFLAADHYFFQGDRVVADAVEQVHNKWGQP
jgi:hypothetical protein